MKIYLPLDRPLKNLSAEVAEVIKHYYPIGVNMESEEYKKHPGVIEIETKIGEHMINYNSYINPWKLFLKNLPKGYKSKIKNSGFAHDLSYSGELVIERYVDASLMRIKKIVFSVSWLAPLFTIYGVDETVIVDEGIGYGYSAINVITVSPYREFEKPFNYLKTVIEEHFDRYKFIPFRLCSFFIKDIQTSNWSLDEPTVHSTLFNGMFNHYYLPSIHTRGENWYGSEMGNSKITVTRPLQK